MPGIMLTSIALALLTKSRPTSLERSPLMAAERTWVVPSGDVHSTCRVITVGAL